MERRSAQALGALELEQLIELVISRDGEDGRGIELRSLRGLEDSVACLLGENSELESAGHHRPMAA